MSLYMECMIIPAACDPLKTKGIFSRLLFYVCHVFSNAERGSACASCSTLHLMIFKMMFSNTMLCLFLILIIRNGQKKEV